MVLPDVIQSCLSRMDYLLMFTFVQFMRSVIERFLSPDDILYVAAASASVTTMCSLGTACSGARATVQTTVRTTVQTTAFDSVVSTMSVVLSALHRAAVLLLANTVMESLRTVHTDDTDVQQALMFFTTATGAVLLIPVFTQAVHNSDTCQQLERLVFFMYAEVSEYITQDTEINHVAPALAVVGLLYVRHWAAAHGQLFGNVVTAVNMLLTNVVLNTLISGAGDAASDCEGEIAWVVTLLMLADQLREVVPDAADLRDYAIWKSAKLVAAGFEYRGAEHVLVLGITLLVAGAAHALGEAVKWRRYSLRVDALVELSLLVAVNTLLAMARNYMQGVPNKLTLLVLLSLLCLVHVATR